MSRNEVKNRNDILNNQSRRIMRRIEEAKRIIAAMGFSGQMITIRPEDAPGEASYLVGQWRPGVIDGCAVWLRVAHADREFGELVWSPIVFSANDAQNIATSRELINLVGHLFSDDSIAS